MDRKEFALFASALKTYYPREALLPNREAMELWYQELQDISYDLATVSLRKWVQTNKWPPTIAEIRKTASETTTSKLPDWGDGWQQTMDMIRKHGFYEPAAAYAEMDDLTREVVRRLGWENLCLSQDRMADRANFRMIYEELATNAKQAAQLSPQLRQLLHDASAPTLEVGDHIPLLGGL